VVVSVFKDNDQAQQAVNDLLNAGFQNDQIHYSVNRGGGGIADDLVNLGVPQQEASFYDNEFQAGHTVVTINTRDRQQQAYDILTRDGGYDVNSGTDQQTNYASNATTNTAVDTGTAAAATAATADTSEEAARDIKLRAEQLQANKSWAQAGEINIAKNVVSEQQTIDVPVTHEEVYVERRPGSGQVSDTPIGEDETIRVPVREEQVDVTKQTVETGEVVVGKRSVTETEEFTDTVRHEEVQVNREGDVDIQGNNPDLQGQ
jgi:uncharacterized protein (TIGR02271 family)